jgi:hypothetical protein
MSGGERVQSSLVDLYADYMLYREAELEDNKKDDDGDGVADVKQIVSALTNPHPTKRCREQSIFIRSSHFR